MTETSSPPTKRNPIRWAVLAVALLVLVPGTIVLASRLGDDPSTGSSPRVGKPAPAFELQTVDGGTVSSADLAGRPYVINFWAPWCPPCRVEHPHLQRFYDAYQGDVEMVGVLIDDSAASARKYRDELGGDWPLVLDPTTELALDLGFTRPPETFVVDKGGIVTKRFVGAVTAGQLEAEMKRIGIS